MPLFQCEVCALPHETALQAHSCALQGLPELFTGTVLYQHGAAPKSTPATIKKHEFIPGIHQFIYMICLAGSERTLWVPDEDFVKSTPHLKLVSNAA